MTVLANTAFDPISATAGGVLIGLASTLLLLCNGRLAGVSGAVHELFATRGEELRWRAWFLGGLLLSGVICASESAAQSGSLVRLAIGGLLVGYGTRLSNGCTSGHGVCGLGRLSKRSLAAVLVFLGAAMVATHVMRHVLGVAA